ncbi:MAG: HNH endonuclease signature motif containing protein [Patescibacteria group bacterium]
MYKLSPPIADSSETYDNSVATIRAKGTQSIYVSAAETIKQRCRTFDLLASSQQFDLAREANFRVPELSDSSMMADLYDKQFARGLLTKDTRDSIRNAAPNSICPYCGDGIVAQLDHYLPKSVYAGITVHPSNLVPSCRDCNHAKKAYAPSLQKSAILHPYFDQVLNMRWLKASLTLNRQNSPIVDFQVSVEPSNIQLEKRLRAHLEVFELYKRYSIKAAQLINDFQAMLTSEYGQNMDLSEARLHLQRHTSNLYGGRINSWEAATYEAMLTSDWYLSEYLGLS